MAEFYIYRSVNLDTEVYGIDIGTAREYKDILLPSRRDRVMFGRSTGHFGASRVGHYEPFWADVVEPVVYLLTGHSKAVIEATIGKVVFLNSSTNVVIKPETRLTKPVVIKPEKRLAKPKRKR